MVHNEDPSKLVLLGAEEGKWAISVQAEDGEDVIYNINVSAIRDTRPRPCSPAARPARNGR